MLYTELEVDAIYDHFENGSKLPHRVSEIADTFTNTMGRFVVSSDIGTRIYKK